MTILTVRDYMDAVDEVSPAWVRVAGVESGGRGIVCVVVTASWWRWVLCGRRGRRRLAVGMVAGLADRIPVAAVMVVSWQW